MQYFCYIAHWSNVALAREDEPDAVPKLNSLFLLWKARGHGPAALGDIRQNGERGGLGGHA
jgi:hypothetical protein